MTYKNCEGYTDPTAGAAVADVRKAERIKQAEAAAEKSNHQVIQVFRMIAAMMGFKIVGGVTLKHKKTGKVFR